LNLLFKNIHIVSPSDKLNLRTDLLIQSGYISFIGQLNNIPANTDVVASNSLTCIPGLFDMHVHFRDPGQENKEDLHTGSLAAANGGFTGVLTMPNTLPPVDNKKTIKYIVEKSSDYLTDIYPSACATKNRLGKEISEIKDLINSGAIAFTDDGNGVQDPEVMKNVFEKTSEYDIVFAQHCEDSQLVSNGYINEGYLTKKLNIQGIPCKSETAMISRDLFLMQYFKNSKYHIQHISCGDSIDIIKKAKAKNIKITSEVCPHHFILTDSECEGMNTNFKMNPPLRSTKDITKILQALKEDYIDVICSDHAPHTNEEKSMKFDKAPFGIIGLETSVGLTYTYLVKTGVISFENMVAKMSINPRKILKLKDIKIQTGEPANLTILSLNDKWKIDKNKFRSKGRNTPFNDYEVYCKPFAVVNKNKIFYSDL
jgi:dihydroorotase